MRNSAFVLLAATCALVQTYPATAQSTTLDAQQSGFLTLINNYRAQNGAGPLQVSATLQESSQWMSNDMAAKNYFSHTDSLRRDPFTRMTAFGYTWYPEGENLAAGYADAQDTFNQWQAACDPDSTGACTYAHRQNMLNPAYKAIGIGRAGSSTSTYGWYWTTDFGAYLDKPLAPPSTSAAPAITSFSATPLTISAGQQVTLRWSVSGATALSINNGVGAVTGKTSITVTPAITTTYTLTATNATGATTSSIAVIVQPTNTPSSIGVFPAGSAPTSYLIAGGPVEFGVKIRSDVAGQITGVRFYKISTNTGVHTGSLWTSDGRLLATGTFANETASGWQTLTFRSPISIEPGATYIASYHTNTGVGGLSFDLGSAGRNNPPLHALQNGVDGPNAVYVFGSGGAFPSQPTSGYDFWVDIVFVP